MNLEKIIIENFKCFQSQTEIEFGKLTLLTGANSSGKSSIIYSILGAIQSGEFPFQFSTNGKYVNMGDFNEIVFNHNNKDVIRISFSFENGIQQIDTYWTENPQNKLPILSKIKVIANYFELSAEKKEKKYIVDFTYNPEKDPQYDFFSADKHTEIVRKLIDALDDIENNELQKKQNGEKSENIWNELGKPVKLEKIEIPESSFDSVAAANNIETFQLQRAFESVVKLFNSYEANINFISSFRLHPDRGYLESSKSNLKVSNEGKGYLDQIIAWETKDSEKFISLVKILKDLNLLYEIKSQRTEGGKYDILIKTKKNGVYNSLYDVGFGVSQFLPIIVADLQLKNSSTLFIAQPEIHLHPSIQSAFGDYLIRQIKTNAKNYVVETHSEYLLNRIRLGIVKGDIEEQDVKIYFAENQSEEATIHKIKFTKTGEILNAPSHFFETYMMDVMEIAINASN